jgi:magnesium-transporting ATPase (P-type)
MSKPTIPEEREAQQRAAHRYVVSAAHARGLEDVLAQAGASADGLAPQEAEARLERVGPNRLPEPPKPGILRRLLKHFNDLLIYILLAAAGVTALLGHWVDTGVILAVVVINAVIGFVQEGKGEQALEGLRKMLSPGATVRRGRRWLSIPAEGLVPGDIVRLKSGDRVPADLRLIDAINLRIEESALTGESLAVEKDTEPAAEDAGLGDRHGMAYSGTMVVQGRGVGVVVATGPSTELGKISRMLSEVQTLATPLTRQMNAFGRSLSAVIGAMAALLFAVGHFKHGVPLKELFLAAIGFAVAAIPEGLPAILTITLALGVQAMANKRAITRRLNAIETLGSITVICSDKTGTLTKNEMTVRHLVTAAGRYSVSGTGYKPEGSVTLGEQSVALGERSDIDALVEVMAVANDSEIKQAGEQWVVVGEPTEGALCSLGQKVGFEADRYTRLATVPFESEHKFMATLASAPDGKVHVLLKGAPERLIARSSRQLGAGGKREPLQAAFWEAEIEALSSEGMRVLSAASREAPISQQELAVRDLQEMTFIGLVGIFDPPRPEAIEAIASCQRAGIRVKMITGDHAGTAKAIGKEMGISSGESCVTGAELEAASNAELQELVRKNDIFARANPEHKLRLVQAMQANGDVVAMTGDGVNDAPALKRADVGVAMGIKGTEATKEAAEIVLADDNFKTIELAVEQGRTIYDNLRKAILFILPTNGAEALVIFAAVFFGFPLPLLPVQILWVNMVTAVTLAIALAFEPAEPGLMERPPRRPDAPILGGLFLWRIGFVATLIGGGTTAVFLIEEALGFPTELARTQAVNTLVLGQAFYLFNARFLHASSLRLAHLFSNPVAWLAVLVLLIVQLGFVYLPPMQSWFGSRPLAPSQWLVSVVIAVVVFCLVEVEKAVVRRMGWQA